jgi:hypothetical protein
MDCRESPVARAGSLGKIHSVSLGGCAGTHLFLTACDKGLRDLGLALYMVVLVMRAVMF